MRNRPFAASSTLWLLMMPLALSVGCATQHGMEDAALSASDQVVALKLELEDQIDSEIDYQNRNLAAMQRAVMDSRSLRMRRMIDAQARQFQESYGQGEAANLSQDDLVALAQSTVEKWQSIEEGLNQALSTGANGLENSRQGHRADLAKLDSLQSKLRTLGQSRDTRQLAGFLFNFLSATADEYLELSTDGGDPGVAEPNPEHEEPPHGQ